MGPGFLEPVGHHGHFFSQFRRVRVFRFSQRQRKSGATVFDHNRRYAAGETSCLIRAIASIQRVDHSGGVRITGAGGVERISLKGGYAMELIAVPFTPALQYIGSRAYVRFEHPSLPLLARWYDSVRRLVENLRAAIPDIALRTTFIVGFPGVYF